MGVQAPSGIPSEEPLPGVRITRLRQQDVVDVAALHLRSLPPSFFSSLGPRFLRRYHESFLASPYGIALVATHQQQFCGFVVGSVAAADHSAWVVRHRGLRLAVSALLAMLVRPRVLARFLTSRGTRYARGLYRRLRKQPRTQAATSPAARQPAVLAHVAVHSAWRRMGLGAVLVRAFETEAYGRDAPRVELVTVEGPSGAASFYERLGYTSIDVRQDGDGRRWRYFMASPPP